jgi:PAS domain-containing protein
METMSEGALTVASDGTILYCNQRFAEMLKAPLEKTMGSPIGSKGRSSDVMHCCR